MAYSKKDRLEAIQVLLAVAMLAGNRSPEKRGEILDKALLAMLVLGNDEQEILSAVVTSGLVEIPAGMMSHLVDL